MKETRKFCITLLFVVCTIWAQAQDTTSAFRDSVALEDVVVKGKLPRSYVKGDAIVTRVVGSVLENAGTAENVLNKLPNVRCTNGAVDIVGRGAAVVYINGRKVQDPNELEQLHSESIKRIEVIQHPGAQYDTSIKAVVKIITKNAEGEGFGILARSSGGFHYAWQGSQTLTMTYNNGPLDIRVSGAGYSSHNGEYSNSETSIYNAKNTSDVVKMPMRCENSDRQHTAQLSYQTNITLNDSVAFGFRYGLTEVPFYEYYGNIYTDIYRHNVIQEHTYSDILLKARSYRHTLNAYYRGSVGKGWIFDINMDGLWYRSKNPNDTKEYTDIYSDGIIGGSTTSIVTSKATTTNDLYAVKAFAEHSLWGGEIMIGSEWTYNKRPTTYKNDQKILPDDEAEMRDKTISAFCEYSRPIGIVNAKIGVRYEHVDNEYKQYDIKIEDGSHVYDDIYPSVSLSAPVGNVQMQLSYSNDVNRPRYRQMMANIFYTNKYYLEQGNPRLEHSTTNSLSYNIAYKWLNVGLSWDAIHNDWMGESRAYSEEHPEIVLSTYHNVPDYNQYYISLSAQPTVGIWSPVLSSNISMQDFKVTIVDKKKTMDKPLWQLTLKNNWKLPFGIYYDADFAISSKGDSGNSHVDEWEYGVNMDIYKTFLNKALVVLFEINDIFESAHSKSTTYNGLYQSNFEYDTKKSFTLSARYKINLAKDKYKGTGAGLSQKQRV